MKSGIKDKNGTEIKAGDTIVIPYVDPMGKIIDDEEGYRAKICFEHGCFGYYNKTHFIPLFDWQATEHGEYIPNNGNKVIYTGKYPFWVAEE